MPGLSLSELGLSHFRSHRLTRLSFDGRPVAIWGPNGAGKTNILEAISLLSPGRGLRGAAPDELPRRPEALGWKITATLDSLGHRHELATWTTDGPPRQVTIDAKTAPQTALGRIGRMLWLVPAMDRLWTEGADGRRRFLDRATMGLIPDHAEAVLAYDKAMRERNRLLRDQVRDPAWYRAIEAQMAQSGANLAANRRAALSMITAAGNGGTVFPAADLSLVGPGGEAEMPETVDALLGAFANGREGDLAAGRSRAGPHRADLSAIWREKGIPAAQCSTGEQKALLISLVLSNARAIASDFGAAPVILLDEVAAHLDDDRRDALYDTIAALRAQAFMTGTAPELFSAFGERAAGLILREETDGSVAEEALIQ